MKIVDKLGGPKAVAQTLGLHKTTVYYWIKPLSRGGSGGVIPAKYVEPLIRHARAQGIRLKPEDFAVRLEQ